MNDIMKSKTDKGTSPKMSLDTALKTIEEADALIKQEIETLSSSVVKQLSADEIVYSTAAKTGIATVLLMAPTTFTTVIMGLDLIAVAVLPVLGLATLLGASRAPKTFGILFCSKKIREANKQAELDGMFMELSKEEFQRKEKEILQRVKTAWDFANKELEEQGHEIRYSSKSGFSIESTKPLDVSQWDAIRLEAIRNKGSKAVGIRPKTKALTS